MYLRVTLLCSITLASLCLTGCGPSKGVQKGTEKNVVLQTNAGDPKDSTRPGLPPEAKTKIDTSPNKKD